jgi:methionyl aminopeptidase
MVVAIEPFATDGPGNVAEAGPAEVFRVPPEREDGAGLDGEVFEAIRAFRGLPFARRQLAGFSRARVEGVLHALWERGRLHAYPPLREALGRPVAQAEHTIYVGTDGVEVLTR